MSRPRELWPTYIGSRIHPLTLLFLTALATLAIPPAAAACRLAQGWHNRGTSLRLAQNAEPHTGSGRSPPSMHDSRVVQSILGRDVLFSRSGQACSTRSSDVDACFLFDISQFPHLSPAKNIRFMPKPELARAWPPASYLIVARSSDADVSAGRIRYRQVVDTERWLEHWTGLWPTDQSSAGWSRADLRLIVRPLALVYLWTELDVAIAKAWAEGPRLSPAQYGAASSRLEACCAQGDVHSFPAELCSAARRELTARHRPLPGGTPALEPPRSEWMALDLEVVPSPPLSSMTVPTRFTYLVRDAAAGRHYLFFAETDKNGASTAVAARARRQSGAPASFPIRLLPFRMPDPDGRKLSYTTTWMLRKYAAESAKGDIQQWGDGDNYFDFLELVTAKKAAQFARDGALKVRSRT